MFQIILKVICTKRYGSRHIRDYSLKKSKPQKANRYSKCTAFISKYYKSTFNTAGIVHKGEKLFTMNN